MTPYKIRSLLVEKNISISDIARELKYWPSAISNVIYGRNKTKKIRSVIAQKLGLDISDIWPIADNIKKPR